MSGPAKQNRFLASLGMTVLVRRRRYFGPEGPTPKGGAPKLDLGKMNIQLIANVENEDRAQCGKNDAGGMVSFVCGARKHVGNGAAEDRSDDAEHGRPEDGKEKDPPLRETKAQGWARRKTSTADLSLG